MKLKWNDRDAEKAKRIAKVAARLFSRKGYLDTSMNEIASAAKFSKGGMYYYFPSKTEILFFILSNYMDLVLDNLEQDLLEINHPRDRLKYLIERHIQLYAKNAPEAQVLLHEANCLPRKYFKIIVEKERQYYQIVSELLPDLVPLQGKAGQLTAITFTLFGMCNWIYSWYDPKGPIAPKELSEIIFNIFLRGIESIE